VAARFYKYDRACKITEGIPYAIWKFLKKDFHSKKAAYNSRLGGIAIDEMDASLDKTPYADNTTYRHLPYGYIPQPQYD